MKNAPLKERLERALPKTPEIVVEAALKTIEAAEKEPKGSAKNILLVRLLSAVLTALERIDTDVETGRVASASSDFEVLLSLLEEPAVLTHLKGSDPLAEAKLRGIRKQMELIDKGGGCVTASEAAEFLGMTKQGVHKARTEGRLLGLPKGQNKYLYPVWQFPKGKILEGLKDVYSAIDGSDWMIASFMLAPNERLNKRTPIEAMKRGQIAKVVEAAKLFGEHGAV